MKIVCTILGCGASVGTPIIGCKCYVCVSENPKNIRKRSSILLEIDQTNILIDVGPDFKAQALEHKISAIEAILFTHAHADHICGIDDLRPIVFKQDNCAIKSYMNSETYKKISSSFGYAIYPDSKSSYAKIIDSCIIKDYDKFYINQIEISSFLQEHGSMNSIGFKVGNFIAYSTDAIRLNKESLDMLKGIEVWIIDCLRYSYSPSHSYLEQTLAWIDIVKPKTAILTHLGHEMDYEELKRILPNGVIPAYDGLKISN